MCGIAGIIYKDSNVVVDESLLRRMTSTLSHRGPDDEGYFVKGNIGFGHKRLSIIDLSGGRQPIFNEDRTITIVFNGEIYNHESLREKLLKRGHRYSTRSDTESILHAYEEYGLNCLDYLRGMFAFAIYDSRKKQIFLARDRVGKKPLYYYVDGKLFLFASELKAILKSDMVKKEINLPMLDFYLSIGYTPGSQTLFKGIHKLEPGKCLLLDEDCNINIKQYWDLDKIPVKNISYSDTCSILKEKLFESVKIRLMSEVPLGVFLSGGLDSSAIVALMSELTPSKIKTFSIGYENEPESSELEYARIVSKRFKTEHYEFFLTPEGLFDSIDTFLEHSEEPLVESAGIALYKLAKLAKPKATVLLSGEGADEIFAGYPIYPKMKTLEMLHFLYKFMPKKIIRSVIKANTKSEKIYKYLDWISEPFFKRYRSMSFDLSNSVKERMFTSNFKNNLNNEFGNYFISLHNKVKNESLLRKMLYIDTKSWLAEDILLKSDRMTMAASVELRAPFLDQEIIEFAYSLPDDYKLRGNIGKYILKDIMKNALPDKIINRKKMGFPVPLTSWFSGELQPRAKSLLTNKMALGRGYFKPEYIFDLFKRINHGEDLGRRIFSLVTLELWHKKYID